MKTICVNPKRSGSERCANRYRPRIRSCTATNCGCDRATCAARSASSAWSVSGAEIGRQVGGLAMIVGSDPNGWPCGKGLPGRNASGADGLDAPSWYAVGLYCSLGRTGCV